MKTIAIELIKDSPVHVFNGQKLVGVKLTLEKTIYRIFKKDSKETFSKDVYPVVKNDIITWCGKDGININTFTRQGYYWSEQASKWCLDKEKSTSSRIENFLGVQQFNGTI